MFVLFTQEKCIGSLFTPGQHLSACMQLVLVWVLSEHVI